MEIIITTKDYWGGKIMPRRGYQFENQLKKIIEYVEKVGGHAHKNHAERLQDGTYIKGEPFDYEVFLPGYHAVFDAKECKARKWYMVDKDIKQCDELKKCKNAGLKAYFLICFEGARVRMIDVDTAISTLRKGSKTIAEEGNPSWDLIEFLGGKQK